MALPSVYLDFLDNFACAHVSDGFMDDDGEGMIGHFAKMKGSFTLALSEVRMLKHRGNVLFRQNHFDEAASCYDAACKLFGISMGGIGSEDIQLLSDLAISLNSNLAACALKLEEFRAALDLCTMILESFPKNVKARFRRAMAYMKLNRFLEAKMDLVEALGVEPKNKDVMRELEVVKCQLLIKANGKRVLEGVSSDERGVNNKKQVHTSDIVYAPESNIEDCESVVMEASEAHEELSVKENVRGCMEMAEATNSGMTNQNSGLEMNGANKSSLEFSKKGGGHSRLRISGQDYQKLLQGNKVMYYHKNDLSTITIQISRIEPMKEEKSTSEFCKKKDKKKRRRLSKPRKRKMGAQDVSSLSAEANNIANDGGPRKSHSGDTSLSTSSFGDNFSSLSIQAPQESPLVAEPLVLKKDTPTISTYPLDNPELKANQFFCFSASSKKSKISLFGKHLRIPTSYIPCRSTRMRISTFKKNHSQGDESPRHNLSTFSKSRYSSSKFLRPCGVSVSCCRYSSRAQSIKKRKAVLAQLEKSDRPIKRPIICVSPIDSLISFYKNVINKSDPEDRVDIM